MKARHSALSTQRSAIPVLTADLTTACPVGSGVHCYGVRDAEMMEFRRRWSHRRVLVAPPKEPDAGYHLMVWACDTDLLWRIVGPPEFMAELETARGLTGIRMHLCRHEIVGD